MLRNVCQKSELKMIIRESNPTDCNVMQIGLPVMQWKTAQSIISQRGIVFIFLFVFFQLDRLHYSENTRWMQMFSFTD